MVAAIGKELVSKPIKIDELEVNTYECDCKIPSKKYWWYDGSVTIDLKIIGNVPEEEIHTLIRELKKK